MIFVLVATTFEALYPGQIAYALGAIWSTTFGVTLEARFKEEASVGIGE